MKPFDQQNYYEILDLQPEALPFEIRTAYKASRELYDNNSMATYSFFSEEERNKILSRLEEAFNTLINHQSRSKYDQRLIMARELEECSLHRYNSKRPIPLFGSKSCRGTKNNTSMSLRPLPSRPAPIPKVIAILAQDVLTGNDLKRIRNELGVSLEEISQMTKIRIHFLRSIEKDHFDELPSSFHLKSFLKSYAQCLYEEPQVVVEKYMKRLKP